MQNSIEPGCCFCVRLLERKPGDEDKNFSNTFLRFGENPPAHTLPHSFPWLYAEHERPEGLANPLH
jgi:hypothetical protein